MTGCVVCIHIRGVSGCRVHCSIRAEILVSRFSVFSTAEENKRFLFFVFERLEQWIMVMVDDQLTREQKAAFQYCGKN